MPRDFLISGLSGKRSARASAAKRAVNLVRAHVAAGPVDVRQRLREREGGLPSLLFDLFERAQRFRACAFRSHVLARAGGAAGVAREAGEAEVAELDCG